MPISDKTQSLIVLVMGILISLGSTQVPADTPDRNMVILIINFAGWIGIAIKEYLGAPTTQLPADIQTVSGTSGIKAQSQPPTNPTDVSGFTPDQ